MKQISNYWIVKDGYINSTFDNESDAQDVMNCIPNSELWATFTDGTKERIDVPNDKYFGVKK